ncbi:MAG TPA: hypothetical protein VFA74_15960, partial [Terriglobales bacterium]|nr:hypothetical protein [Terriglobales bacterium]
LLVCTLVAQVNARPTIPSHTEMTLPVAPLAKVPEPAAWPFSAGTALNARSLKQACLFAGINTAGRNTSGERLGGIESRRTDSPPFIIIIIISAFIIISAAQPFALQDVL